MLRLLSPEVHQDAYKCNQKIIRGTLSLLLATGLDSVITRLENRNKRSGATDHYDWLETTLEISGHDVRIIYVRPSPKQITEIIRVVCVGHFRAPPRVFIDLFVLVWEDAESWWVA